MPESKSQRKRRTPEQQIADLKAKIADIQARAERTKVKKDPTLRHIGAAVRSIDKALQATRDAAMRQALAEARTTLDACLKLSGVSAPRSGRSVPTIEPDDVVRYLEKHPGSKAEDVAAAIRVDTKAVSPVLKRLRDEGRVRVEGKARGTRYFA